MTREGSEREQVLKDPDRAVEGIVKFDALGRRRSLWKRGRESTVQNFTPVSGLIGGLLIGLATVLMMLFNGKIAGISGIVGGLLARKASEVGWRAVFVVGLLLGAFVYMLATGGPIPVRIEASLPVMVAAGFLVGFGTRLGSGCTSGHGISGIARFSKRSIVATLVFVGMGMISVFVTHHVL
jgi:uncharacterized protein